MSEFELRAWKVHPHSQSFDWEKTLRAYRSSLEIIRTDGNRALVKGSEAEVRRLNKISKGRILFSPVTPHPREKVK